MNITIKGLKVSEFASEETLCFQAGIYLDGKKVGSVRNQGTGGCNFYYWNDRETGRKIEAWADDQPAEFDFEKLDQIINDMVYAEQDRQWLKRHCRKKTLFRLHGDSNEAWRTLNAPYSEKVQAWLDKKYGDKVSDIANLQVAA